MSYWYQNGACLNNRLSGEQTFYSLICHRPVRVAIGLGVSLLAGSIGLAQEAETPAFSASLDVSQRLEYSDNPDLEADGQSDSFGRTTLGFGLESITNTQEFSLTLGTDIEEGRADQSSFDFKNTFGELFYQRQGARAGFDLALFYRESDVAGDQSDADLDPDVVFQQNGTRDSYGIALSGNFGQDLPVGGGYGLSYDEITFDSSDPDLTDRSVFDASGQIDFQIDPRITGRLIAGYNEFDTDGLGVDREKVQFGVGASLEISPLLRADVQLSYDKIDRSGTQTASDEGLSFAVSLDQTRPKGSIGVSFSTDVTSSDDGRRSNLTLDQQLELSALSSLSYTLGATYSASDGVDPLFSLDYQKQTRTGNIGVQLSQTVTTNTDNNEQISTQLSASYDHTISSLSNLGVGLSFFNRNELGPSAEDAQRINIDLTYRRSLTQDWGLLGGVSHRLIKSDTASDRSSNTVFVGLERTFDWAP